MKIALLAVAHEHGGVDLSKVEPPYKSALKSPIWTATMKEEFQQEFSWV